MRAAERPASGRATHVSFRPLRHTRANLPRTPSTSTEMAHKALILLIASLVLGVGALVVLLACALQGKVITAELNNLMWMLVGQLATTLGIFTEARKQ